ncbi:MAG: PEP-CTERM sorting domain-containing protein [Verrucomicrobia bacterium]|nr:PEP-CTERM sorting domain-containing protein [Verrucomicrobiota bacterium]
MLSTPPPAALRARPLPRLVPAAAAASVAALLLAGIGEVGAPVALAQQLASGTVDTWGANSYGQLGNGAVTDSSVPVAVSSANGFNNTGVTAVAPGSAHSLAIQNGTVYAWGLNGSGQLGNNSTTQSSVPVAVSAANGFTNTGVTAVAGGGAHSLALQNGTVYAWGYNNFGGLGNNSTTQSSVPVAVNSANGFTNSGVTSVAAGNLYSLAIQNGSVYAWGYNTFGQLGNNSTTDSHVPVAVSSANGFTNTGVTAVAAGSAHNLALQNGVVYAWGFDTQGELGNGTNPTDSPVPVAVNNANGFTNTGVTAVAAGYAHSLALQNGVVYAWGDNSKRQLGTASLAVSFVPIRLTLSGITAIAATSYSSYALAGDGSLWVWGDNSRGELGDGTTTDQSTPEHLLPPSGYLYTALDGNADGNHVEAILSPAAVPEPSTWALLSAGALTLLGLGRARRRRKALA